MTSAYEPTHLPLPEPSTHDWQAQEQREADEADARNDEEWLRERAGKLATTMSTVDGMLSVLDEYGPAARAIGLCLYTRGRADSMREAVERAAGVRS